MADLSHASSLHNIFLSPQEDALCILDQSLLPNELLYRSLQSAKELHEAIANLRVRGAPAIGIFAAFALYLLCKESAKTVSDPMKLLAQCRRYADFLNSARPTAVNLSKMLNRCLQRMEKETCESISAFLTVLKAEALAIQADDVAMCKAISQYGLSLLKDGDCLLTHCNAGPLATSRYGTALGPLLLGREQGMTFHVFCDETRPLLQGARLTTFELTHAEIPCTLICDNMAGLVMSQGRVDACLVGCDRVARNGDTANKIGTASLAVLAHYYHIPFYVLGPSSTIDFSCPDGTHIPIEERDGSEIKDLFFQKPSALEGVTCYNPAFDVTPASLITAIVTERGLCYPPFEASFAQLFPEEYQEGKP